MSQSQKRLSELTEEDWRMHHWVEITTWGDREKVFVRGEPIVRPKRKVNAFVRAMRAVGL